MFLRAQNNMPPESEPLRLRQWKPVSLSEGVLMALTHCLELQNIKKWQIRDILGDALEEVKETEVTHSGLTLWQAPCQVCCTQHLVDMSRHHEAGLWFLQVRPRKHRESRILFKGTTGRMGPWGTDITMVPLRLQSAWTQAALALQGFIPADCMGF